MALSAALALSGCSDSPGPEADEPAPQPPETTRFADPTDLGEALYEAALEAGTASGTVDATSDQADVSAEVQYRFDDDVSLAGVASVSSSLDLDSNVVLADGVIYLSVPLLYRLFVPADWVRVPVEGNDELGQQAREIVQSLSVQVPGEWLLGLDETDAALVPLGADTVAGTQVQRYQVTADQGAGEITRTYWVDGNDLLRRLDSTMGVPGAGSQVTSTHTFDDWGLPVTINVPDPDQVTDLPEGLL